nr:hypothetical protein [Tanacetum cinerariifolium]
KAALMGNFSSYGSDALFEVVQIFLWCLDFRCSKDITRDRSQLTNFVHKFLGTVKFGNDQVAKIIGEKYILVIMDDYSRFTWVKFLASKDEAPDFIINYYESVGISHVTLVVRSSQQTGVVEKQNRTLVEAARTMLIYTKASLFIKPDLSYIYVFGALCYPNIDIEDLGILQAKADISIFIGYAPKKKAYSIYNRRTQDIIETIHVNFDELTAIASEQLSLGLGLQIITLATSIAAVPRTVDLVDLPVSTSIDQDDPSTSIPSTQDQEHSLIISQGFKESPKTTHFHDDPLHESLHKDSNSQGSSSNVRPIHTPFESLGRWTKDHPISYVIEDHSHSVSTRKQL